MERGSLLARQERLAQLATKVGPVSFARDRLLPVVPTLEPLLPDGGIARGSIIGCHGAAAMSITLAAVAGASAAGSWLAVVGLASLGLRAASEVGIALERLVMVAEVPSLSEAAWANMTAALIDGFDLVVIRGGPHIRAGTARRLQARLQARGAVLIVVGDPGHFACDVDIRVHDAVWEGLGDGAGRLVRRRLTLSVSGRRLARPRHAEVWLPGGTGGIEAVTAATTANTVTNTTANTVTDTTADTVANTAAAGVVALQRAG